MFKWFNGIDNKNTIFIGDGDIYKMFVIWFQSTIIKRSLLALMKSNLIFLFIRFLYLCTIRNKLGNTCVHCYLSISVTKYDEKK